jgi:large subunit ribosomal protein L30
MANTNSVRIRWVRSGIAFNRKQKEIVRSLGLRRLHQVVERPDNAAVRGLVAKVAHLVEIVDGEDKRVRPSVPEYAVAQVESAEPPAPESAPALESALAPADLEAENAQAEVESGN